MAIVANIQKVSFRPYLNDGYDSSGNIKTVAASFPAISSSVYATDLVGSRAEAYAVMNAIAPLYGKSVYTNREVITNTLEDE